jgi:hypothetical protein
MSGAFGQETRNAIDKDIDSVRRILFDVALDFHDSTQPPATSIDGLNEALQRVNSADGGMFPLSIRAHPAWRRYQQDLTFALFQFDLLRSQPINNDSLRDAFRGLLFAFHHLCGPYFYQRATSTAEKKVLLFVASITCECTRRMCDEYTAELVRLRKNQENGFDLVIIDAVVSPDLLKMYDVETIPSAIAMGKANKETGRLAAGENVRARALELIERVFGESQ